MSSLHGSAVESFAYDYAAKGWLLVPINGFVDGQCGCGNAECRERSRGKHPIFKAWQKNASRDESIISEWCAKWPELNIGVKLGPDSGIIDVEFDGDEGREVADKLLAECFTPTFSSGRSVHRIFKFSDQLPDVQKVMVAGLEVRIGGGGKGTQTVFPPSRHHSGAVYKWLEGLDPETVDVQPIPEALLALLWNDPNCPALPGMAGDGDAPKRPQEHWDRTLAGVAEGDPNGGRNESAASVSGKMLRNLADIENAEALAITWSMLKAWNERNRPPLDEKELKTTFSSIVRNERTRRANEQIHGALPKTSTEQIDDATAGPEGEGNAEGATEDDGNGGKKYTVGNKRDLEAARIVIIESDPPLCQVFSPRFAQAPGGRIELPLGDLLVIPRVQRAALEQARYVMPRFKQGAWEAHIRGLVDSAEVIKPPPEATKSGVLAARVLASIKNLVADKDGGVIQAFSDLRLRVSAGEPGLVSNRDLGLFLASCGADRRRNENSRAWYFTPDVIDVLRSLAGYNA